MQIAKHGICGSAKVIGSAARRGNSIRTRLYTLTVEGDLLDAQGQPLPFVSSSLEHFRQSEVDSYVGRAVDVIWHPDHPNVAIVKS